MKQIVVSLDFFAEPKKALRQVLTFLRGVDDKFKLYLLKSYMVPASAPHQLISIHDSLKQQTQDEIDGTLQGIQSSAINGNIQLKAMSHMGTAANVVCNMVDEYDIDCVIVGKSIDLESEDMLRMFCQSVLPYCDTVGEK